MENRKTEQAMIEDILKMLNGYDIQYCLKCLIVASEAIQQDSIYTYKKLEFITNGNETKYLSSHIQDSMKMDKKKNNE